MLESSYELQGQQQNVVPAGVIYLLSTRATMLKTALQLYLLVQIPFTTASCPLLESAMMLLTSYSLILKASSLHRYSYSSSLQPLIARHNGQQTADVALHLCMLESAGL